MRFKVLSTISLLILAVVVPGIAQSPSRRYELVSVSSNEVQADNDSDRGAISADGHFVAFASLASDLVPNDFNEFSDIFVRDRRTGTTERVSVGPLGVEGDGNSGFLSLLGAPDISADGRFVAFASEATNLVIPNTNGSANVYVHDRRTGTTELIGVGPDGLAAGGSAPSISGDGRFVAFRSFGDLVDDGQFNFFEHAYVYDRRLQKMERADVASDGTLAGGSAFDVIISSTGRHVAFDSFASNLVRGDGDNGGVDVFVRDRRTGKTEAVSLQGSTDTMGQHSLLSSISADGRFVGFQSSDPTLVRRDANGFEVDAFVFDRETRRLTLVSVDSAGRQGTGESVAPLVSGDGRFVVFSSLASLVRQDANQARDVYLRDLYKETTERLVADEADEQFFAFPVLATDITPDVSNLALLTRANLVPEQDVGFFVEDVYVLDRREEDRYSVTTLRGTRSMSRHHGATSSKTVTVPVRGCYRPRRCGRHHPRRCGRRRRPTRPHTMWSLSPQTM